VRCSHVRIETDRLFSIRRSQGIGTLRTVNNTTIAPGCGVKGIQSYCCREISDGAIGIVAAKMDVGSDDIG